MAYVVIVCSRCRLARGAPEHARTATCPNCGRKLRIAGLKKYHRTSSLAELAEAIGQLNARLRGGLDAYLDELGQEAAPGIPPPAEAGGVSRSSPLSFPPRAEARGVLANFVKERPSPSAALPRSSAAAGASPSGPPVPSPKLDRAILEALEKRGPQRVPDILAGLPPGIKTGRLERRLEALCRAGLVFEPSTGVFERVP